MILSPYQNPPYKALSRNINMNGAAPRSPKRKRSQASFGLPPLATAFDATSTSNGVNVTSSSSESGAAATATMIPTPLHDPSAGDHHLDDPSSGTDSPRMKVAHDFTNLRIQPQGGEGASASAADDEGAIGEGLRLGTPCKRVKRDADVYREASTTGGWVSADEASDVRKVVGYPRVEIQETPGCRDHPSFPNGQDRVNFNIVNGTPDTWDSTSRVETSPFLTTSNALNNNHNNDISLDIPTSTINRSSSPLPNRRNPLNTDDAALTWQEDEITGHEIDPGGDDDGEGINGIGFRPTPAMAYARKQRRRQQVHEWKAREAREARQRRFEKRRGGGPGARHGELELMAGSGGKAGRKGTDGEGRRAVRFAEVG